MYSSGTTLRFVKKRNRYENSTRSLTYDPLTCEARSYDHWLFTKRVGNKILFNYYSYSPTTSKHQRCIEYQFNRTLAKNNVVYFSYPKSLDTRDFEIEMFDEAYRNYRIAEEILKLGRINERQRKKTSIELDHNKELMKEYKVKFTHVKDIDRNTKAIDKEVRDIAKNRVDYMVKGNEEAAKARKEKYWHIEIGYDGSLNNRHGFVEHPFYELVEGDKFQVKKVFCVSKKDYKKLITLCNYFKLTIESSRKSIDKVPKGVELITADMHPELARTCMQEEVKEVFK